MAVPSLPTALNAGDVVSNAWVDSVRENLAWFRDDRPVFKGYGWDGVASPANEIATATTTAQSFGNAGSFAQITGLGTNPYINVGGWTVYAADPNPEALLVPETGIYLLTASAQWDTNSTGYRDLRVLINGSTEKGARVQDVAGAAGDYQTVTVVADLAANNQIDMNVYQNSGSTLTLTTYFSAVWMQSS